MGLSIKHGPGKPHQRQRMGKPKPRKPPWLLWGFGKGPLTRRIMQCNVTDKSSWPRIKPGSPVFPPGPVLLGEWPSLRPPHKATALLQVPAEQFLVLALIVRPLFLKCGPGNEHPKDWPSKGRRVRKG